MDAQQVWKHIVDVLDEQLQYGFLEQVKAVRDVKIDGSELTLFVTNDESYDFFASDVNAQRVMIISRQVCPLETIRLERIDPESD